MGRNDQWSSSAARKRKPGTVNTGRFYCDLQEILADFPLNVLHLQAKRGQETGNEYG